MGTDTYSTSSVADLAVIPIQDYLCLGNEARMNAPSTFGDNWEMAAYCKSDFGNNVVSYERSDQDLWTSRKSI